MRILHMRSPDYEGPHGSEVGSLSLPNLWTQCNVQVKRERVTVDVSLVNCKNCLSRMRPGDLPLPKRAP